ncbi:hypothetical protein [Flavobacterium ginsengiterrae]|uniref:Uncharacterized protein n=1 Tax=Flavobacterium ginsengiterrae TaxID=871695 RepID=A0ABP7GQU6_9FLAO
MERNYLKEYIEFSNEFRKSGGSKESVGKLYDLLNELESLNRTKENNQVLSNVYILLGFHESAYDIFKETADVNNQKDVSKLYVMEQKAKTHGNNFIIKDIRKLQEKKKQAKLIVSDFVVSENDLYKFGIPQKEIVIFNKAVKDKIEVYFPDSETEKYIDIISEYLSWLADCKNDLIEFYNQNNEFTDEKADNDWYDTLDIYRVVITITTLEDIEAFIAAGDSFSQDHILDFEITNKTIISMNYDG